MSERARRIIVLGTLAVLGAICVNSSGALRRVITSEPPALARSTEDTARGASPKLPVSFEANQGQSDPTVRFLSSAHNLFLTNQEAAFIVSSPGVPLRPGGLAHGRTGGHSSTQATVRMRAVGANPHPELIGEDRQPARTNYLTGSDPTQWHVGVPTFGAVRYREIYSGIDLVYHGDQGRIEYDFILAPGRDSRAINLAFQGQDGLGIDAAGDLILHTGAGDQRQPKPLVYQDVTGVRRAIAGSYVLSGRDRVAFVVGPHDGSRPLIIDPVLIYSTYLGGTFSDRGRDIAVDSGGNAYVTGTAESADFPHDRSVGSSNGQRHVFVTKVSPQGNVLVFSTFIGGSRDDEGFGIAVGRDGTIYVGGATQSSDFPVKNSFESGNMPFQFKAFVLRLNAGGTSLLYSTYLGGGADSSGCFGIATDGSGGAYAVGTTQGKNFPTTGTAVQATLDADNPHAFASWLDTTRSGPLSLVYSTYLGGQGNSTDGRGIAVGGVGDAFITGAFSPGGAPRAFPLTPSHYPTVSGASDAFVTRIDMTKAGVASLRYSTFLGGSADNYGNGIAADQSGHAYVTGATTSRDFPVKGSPIIQATNHSPATGGYAAFVTKMDTGQSGDRSLVYSTYLGGAVALFIQDGGNGIAIDPGGDAYVTGQTSARDFPTVGDPCLAQTLPPPTAGANQLAFVSKINATGSGLVYSTYLGGAGLDDGFGIAVNANDDNAYVTGWTQSSDFPTKNPYQQNRSGVYNAFVSRIGVGCPNAPVVTGVSPNHGSTAGGDLVVVSGLALSAASTVYVDTTGVTAPCAVPPAVGPGKAACFSVAAGPLDILGKDAATRITMVTPPHALPGSVHVSVETPGGRSSATQLDLYTYETPAPQGGPCTVGCNLGSGPAITTLSPQCGSTGGGTAVHLIGSGFVKTSAVTFDAVPSPNPLVNPAGTDITVISPKHAQGTVPVVVTTPYGQAAYPFNYTDSCQAAIQALRVTGRTPSLKEPDGTPFNSTGVKAGGMGPTTPAPPGGAAAQAPVSVQAAAPLAQPGAMSNPAAAARDRDDTKAASAESHSMVGHTHPDASFGLAVGGAGLGGGCIVVAAVHRSYRRPRAAARWAC